MEADHAEGTIQSRTTVVLGVAGSTGDQALARFLVCLDLYV